ncbi:MAG: sugar phosphate nucleotidyltransferase [Verrucomicrobiota bacterium]|nr:sugar phosphate nucleotidyltransferase [Verrucomicrobiota bacterium]
MQPTLLLLAAGMGSRYGGLKQLDAMGPSDETMIDYAVKDACRAGFAKVVFVIRKDFEEAFRKQIGDKHAEKIEVGYAFQDLHDLPADRTPPEGRTKPWGTAHAVRAARNIITEPFAVINADDFYGREAYDQMARQLQISGAHSTELSSETGEKLRACMVGYTLRNTLSPHGTVNRGICVLDRGKLQSVQEYTAIGKDAGGKLSGKNQINERVPLSAEAVVSMNFWGFTPAIFEPLEAHFEAFLQANGQEPKSEYYLPSLIDSLVKTGEVECSVLQTQSPWFGVTYPEDKARVIECIQKLTDAGVYSL